MLKPSKSQLIVLLIIVALAFGGGMQVGRYRQGREQAAANLLTIMEDASAQTGGPPTASLPETQPSASPLPLAVHVKGAVAKPGLYKLPPGSRVADALDMAGLLPEANTDIINLALALGDGAEVVVPFRIEGEETDWEALAISAAIPTVNTADPVSSSTAASAAVNINSANLAALQTLSGIGPAKAQAIIDYREQHGPFAKIEDIKKVSGIGPSTYDKIKDHISVE